MFLFYVVSTLKEDGSFTFAFTIRIYINDLEVRLIVIFKKREPEPKILFEVLKTPTTRHPVMVAGLYDNNNNLNILAIYNKTIITISCNKELSQ